jgi:uncharacterized protein YbaR (Trm112 family)
MHLLLTDRLSCPRCGPEFGLILMADEMVERRVVAGSLGCPNCRDRYPVSSGFADLRPPPRPPLSGESSLGGGETLDVDAMTVAALLGIPGGPGNVLLGMGVAHLATELSGLVEGIEWIVVAGSPDPDLPAGPFSPMGVRGRLPLYSRSIRGAVTVGGAEGVPLAEYARVVAPMGRLVILAPSEDTAAAVAAAGLELVLDTGDAVVGGRKS